MSPNFLLVDASGRPTTGSPSVPRSGAAGPGLAARPRAPAPSQFGWTPLHGLCKNSSATPELLKVMVEAYPGAAKEKDGARPRRGEEDAFLARQEISS